MGPSYLSASMFDHIEQVGAAVKREPHFWIMILSLIWAYHWLPLLKLIAIFITLRKYITNNSSPVFTSSEFLIYSYSPRYIISAVHRASLNFLPNNQLTTQASVFFFFCRWYLSLYIQTIIYSSVPANLARVTRVGALRVSTLKLKPRARMATNLFLQRKDWQEDFAALNKYFEYWVYRVFVLCLPSGILKKITFRNLDVSILMWKSVRHLLHLVC